MSRPFQVTGLLQQQAWADRLLPPVEKVQDGLWSIPVPIPNNPLRYVLVYVLELDDGVALVDAGWDTPEAWTALTEGLATAGGSVSDVRAVLVTHIHPDHYGLAGRVRESSGAWVGLHPDDAALLPARYGAGVPDLLREMHDLLRSCGVPEQELGVLADASLPLVDYVRQVLPDRMIEDGEWLPLPGWDLRAVHTPGHSPGHLCFHEPGRRVLLSGDHVLPRITPNVGVHAQSAGDPLAEFLASLARVSALDADVDEVLPAHEYRFAGIGARVEQLLGHHEHRLEEIRTASTGRTTWALTGALTWSRPWDQVSGFMRRAAVAETLAHLVLLESRGQVRRTGLPWAWEAA
ncbi:MBL fold metallo-hydrolase [Nocardioides sp. 31GB23]|uniref:MBL fold metallo-hydrolase n=1 Tax=Nocardioides cremeus TaxID=3058044 RepID=A0ABT8TV51_9ACTN|nr:MULTISPECIES: MBL fold metallo-hydrolase [Nocardioides]MDO3397834.1 MBL fold metallo-hydrolase [Nocardioides cremeus]